MPGKWLWLGGLLCCVRCEGTIGPAPEQQSRRGATDPVVAAFEQGPSVQRTPVAGAGTTADKAQAESPLATASGATRCTGLGGEGAPLPLRRLNAAQVQRTVQDLFGTVPQLSVVDEKLGTYRSNISTALDLNGTRGYLDFAEALSAEVALERCAEDCSDWLLDTLGPGLFRRPLTGEERSRYRALYEAYGGRATLEGLLQSPSFLYVDEWVAEDGYLDGYAIAGRLAFMLWGRNPDAALLALAEQGGLATAAAVRETAAGMLADPRSAGGLADFVEQWLGLEGLSQPDARPDLTALGAETLEAMGAEPVTLFVQQVKAEQGLGSLLTTRAVPLLEPLRTVYGADVVDEDAQTLFLDPSRRAGLLSLPGVMAAHAHAEATSPTLRGFTVLASLLCAPPPPPPAGVAVTLPVVDPEATLRQRLEAHLSDASCAACHESMDGIGFAFEGIDWLGRSRSEEQGQPIDARGRFVLGAKTHEVDGVTELSAVLAESPEVATCVARQWLRYASFVPETAAAECLIAELSESLMGPAGLKEMMLTFVTSDWFRKGPAGGNN